MSYGRQFQERNHEHLSIRKQRVNSNDVKSVNPSLTGQIMNPAGLTATGILVNVARTPCVVTLRSLLTSPVVASQSIGSFIEHRESNNTEAQTLQIKLNLRPNDLYFTTPYLAICAVDRLQMRLNNLELPIVEDMISAKSYYLNLKDDTSNYVDLRLFQSLNEYSKSSSNSIFKSQANESSLTLDSSSFSSLDSLESQNKKKTQLLKVNKNALFKYGVNGESSSSTISSSMNSMGIFSQQNLNNKKENKKKKKLIMNIEFIMVAHVLGLPQQSEIYLNVCSIDKKGKLLYHEEPIDGCGGGGIYFQKKLIGIHYQNPLDGEDDFMIYLPSILSYLPKYDNLKSQTYNNNIKTNLGRPKFIKSEGETILKDKNIMETEEIKDSYASLNFNVKADTDKIHFTPSIQDWMSSNIWTDRLPPVSFKYSLVNKAKNARNISNSKNISCKDKAIDPGQKEVSSREYVPPEKHPLRRLLNAIRHHGVEILQYEIEKNGVDNFLELETIDGKDIFHFTAYIGSYFCFEYLYQRININQRPLHKKTKDAAGDMIGHVAARQGNLHILKILQQLGYDFNRSNNYGQTPLHSAVTGDYPCIIEWMVQFCDVHIRDKEGFTAAHNAALTGKSDSLKALITVGQYPVIDSTRNFLSLGKGGKESSRSKLRTSKDNMKMTLFECADLADSHQCRKVLYTYLKDTGRADYIFQLDLIYNETAVPIIGSEAEREIHPSQNNGLVPQANSEIRENPEAISKFVEKLKAITAAKLDGIVTMEIEDSTAMDEFQEDEDIAVKLAKRRREEEKIRGHSHQAFRR